MKPKIAVENWKTIMACAVTHDEGVENDRARTFRVSSVLVHGRRGKNFRIEEPYVIAQ